MGQQPQAVFHVTSMLIVNLVLLTCLCFHPCTGAGPRPLAVPVSTEWFGTDGNWSPVNIRVGSPPQWLSVFPNTAGQETWVIGRSGCDDTFICRNKRGGLFFPNESSTWKDVGFYELGFNLRLNYSGPGYYGYDSIALNEDMDAPSQIVAVVNDTQYWLGYMGLGIKETNFTDSSKPTFLSTLVENQSLIPSHSYGYTAGAYYRLKGVPASLTLGGFDRNRFQQNNLSFELSPDNLPVVAIDRITVSANASVTTSALQPAFSSPLTLLEPSSDNRFTVDSSTAFIWLPETVCDAFADALGLVYNETLQVYTYGKNSSARDTLVNWNLTFTFSISNLPGSSNTVNINLPFSAFDHELSYPFPNLDIAYTEKAYNYFPLRRATNNAQYTLGRVFLQEAYLIVDYERGNFSISQAKFAMDALTNMDLIGIDTTNPTRSTGSSLSKVGIGIGTGVAALLILAIVTFCIFKRWRRNEALKRNAARCYRKRLQLRLFEKKPKPVELHADLLYPVEVPADSSHTVFELPGDSTFELPGSDVEPVDDNVAVQKAASCQLHPTSGLDSPSIAYFTTSRPLSESHNSGRPSPLQSIDKPDERNYSSSSASGLSERLPHRLQSRGPSNQRNQQTSTQPRLVRKFSWES